MNPNGEERIPLSKVYVFDHPLIQHKLTYIRDKNTGTKEFRELVDEVATLMAFEITRDMPVEEIEIETPVTIAKQKYFLVKTCNRTDFTCRYRYGRWRIKAYPCCKVGHIGLYRDPETLKPVEYYAKLPADVEERDFIIVDPMLATGGSAVEAIHSLKKRGAKTLNSCA